MKKKGGKGDSFSSSCASLCSHVLGIDEVDQNRQEKKVGENVPRLFED